MLFSNDQNQLVACQQIQQSNISTANAANNNEMSSYSYKSCEAAAAATARASFLANHPTPSLSPINCGEQSDRRSPPHVAAPVRQTSGSNHGLNTSTPNLKSKCYDPRGAYEARNGFEVGDTDPNIQVKLESRHLWQQFATIGTEMIITKCGR